MFARFFREVLFAGALCAGLCAWPNMHASATESARSLPIVEFFNIVKGMKARWTEELKGLAEKDSTAASYLIPAMARHSDDELARRLGTVLDADLSAQDIKAFEAVAATEAGKQVKAIFRKVTTEAELNAVIAALPAASQRKLNTFFNSPAVERAIKAMESPKINQAAYEYGESLVCEHAKAIDESKYSILISAGKCGAGK